MKLKTKYFRVFCLVCAAVLMTAALSVSAFAADSIADQMAANSAAWWVAHNAGDQATCDALHAANVALAAQAASGGGSSSYNEHSGTWDITTSSGSNISSSSSQDGKQTTSTYTTTTSSGRVASTSTECYSDDSISSYMGHGGTNQGLQTSYNNAAAAVTSNNSYGSTSAQNSAAGEVAVAKALLGLSNAEAKALQRELELSKQAYDAAQTAYNKAVRRGDTTAAKRAKAQMNAAHDAAQAAREKYYYTGDEPSSTDGGYYHDGNGGSSGGNGGGFYVSTGVSATYKITASCGEGGTITPNGTTTVRKGQSQSYSITPNAGYKIKSVMIDGANQDAISSYTFSNVKKAHTISATFEKSTSTITASAGTGGSISPAGTVSVTYGGSMSFTITPATGYKIKSVTVDDVNKGAIGSFTFSNVTGTHTISVSFEKQSFTISASAGTGGSISPSGSVNVAYGESKSFTVIPDTGYKIKSVTVDGVNKGAISSYTISNVTGPHNIAATFVPAGVINLDPPSTESTTGVNIANGAIKSGYGITASAHATYSDVSDVRLVMAYNFGSGVKTVTLEETASGRFEFPVNSSSPTGARCVYIPVGTADGTYTLTYTMTARNAAGEMLKKTSISTLTVRGSMYEDDFTGDS